MEKRYPSRLFHKTRSWVTDGSVSHIRIRCSAENGTGLTVPKFADVLLRSDGFYTDKGRWRAHLFLLMPDHLDALLSFPKEQAMSQIISEWKRYQTQVMLAADGLPP